MQAQIKTVSFHGQQLAVIPQQDKLFVAIKPICENIGVQWHAQRKRIHRDTVLSQGASMMDSPSKGGEQQTFCLPLELLNGWLFGIDDSRIKNPEIKERVIQYKRECYQVLFDYWTKGQATNPRQPKPKAGQLTLEQQSSIKELVKARVEALPQKKQAGAAIRCWSSLKSKFGCTYKQIPAEQFPEAVSLIARLPLEGELLALEQHDATKALDYSAERWLQLNPQLNHRPRKARFHITAELLYGPDANTPISHLLTQLSNQGHDMQACRMELMALRHHLENTRNALNNITRTADFANTTSLVFKIN